MDGMLESTRLGYTEHALISKLLQTFSRKIVAPPLISPSSHLSFFVLMLSFHLSEKTR